MLSPHDTIIGLGTSGAAVGFAFMTDWPGQLADITLGAGSAGEQLTVALPLLSALLAAVAAWYATSRQRSGKIATSEASDLWAESQSIRQELRAEVVRLRGLLTECEERGERLLAQLTNRRSEGPE